MMQADNLSFLVSICSITYNHAPYIRQCLDSMLMQQTNFDYEIIINDDCSTDGTTEIIKEYESKYPHIIKPIYHDENQYSKGVRGMFAKFVYPQAQGKYIAICEGDDYWTDPLKLQKQVDFLESHPDYTMCFTRAAYFSQRQNKIIKDFRSYKQSQKAKAEDVIWEGGHFMTTCSIVFRKEILDTYPDYCRKCHVGDYPLQIYGAMIGNVYYLDDSTGVYRMDNPTSWCGQFTSTLTAKNISKFQSEIDMLNGLAQDYPQYKKVIKKTIANYICTLGYRKSREERKDFENAFRQEIDQFSPFWKFQFGKGYCYRKRKWYWRLYKRLFINLH